MIVAMWLGLALAEPLSLDAVLESAQAHLPLVVAAQAQLEQAQAREAVARGAFDPRLTGSAYSQPLGGYTYGTAELELLQPIPWTGVDLGVGYRLGEGEVPVWLGDLDTSAQGELYAELSVPLLQGVRVDSERAALLNAMAAVDGGEAALARVRLDTSRDATIAWLRWVAAGQRLALAEELLGLAVQRDGAVARRVEAGQLAEIDRLDTQRVVPERRARLADAEQELARAEAELSLYWRDAEGRSILPDRALLPVGPGELDYTPPADPVGLALARRPEFLSLQAAIEQAEVQLRLARASLYPKLDAKAALSRDPGYADYPVQGKVGLELSTPAFRAAAGRVRDAEANLAALQARLRWLEDSVRAEVHRAVAEQEAAQARFAAARESAALARRVAEAEARRFELGDSELLRVWLREQTWAEAALAEIAAQLDAHAAVARLRATLGDPGPFDGSGAG